MGNASGIPLPVMALRHPDFMVRLCAVTALEEPRGLPLVARSRLTRRVLQASLVVALMGSACGPTTPENPATWGSDQASLSIADNRATVQVLAAGGCYGAYGEFDHAIVSGTFTLSGTYTQLMGAYRGRNQYAAEYAGTIVGNAMTLSIDVPALQQTIGPFRLIAGVTSAWSACLYP
jgi:hypothetical protein